MATARKVGALCVLLSVQLPAPVHALVQTRNTLPHTSYGRIPGVPHSQPGSALLFGSDASLSTAASQAAPSTLRLRGGNAGVVSLDRCFNNYFAGLVGVCTLTRIAARSPSSEKKVNKAWDLQWRFLSVFWALKLADWLHGPYFYEVYASKIINGQALGQEMIGKLFLCGFGASMIFGTVAGTLVDSMGRKKGCFAFCLMYMLSALSTLSNSLPVLVLGRVLGGTATSLLFSAPEAWLVSEHARQGLSGADLGATFGWAYFGDGIAAILAGKLAGAVAGRAGGKGSVLSGPTAPFELSILFLAMGVLFIGTNFQENYGGHGHAACAASRNKGVVASLKEATNIIINDKRILLTGVVQSLFEGAMYIFVLQWPPALSTLAAGRKVPFGAVFACLMTACMIGSSVFGLLLKYKVAVEASIAGMLGLSCAAIAISAQVMAKEDSIYRQGNAPLHVLTVAFLVFEMAVGLYFPSIGTLRSKYVPDAHKGSIMNVFRIPLNLIVISTFLSIKRLGVSGALYLASAVLAMACVAQSALLMLPPPSTVTAAKGIDTELD